MSGWWIALIVMVVIALVIFGVYLSSTAGRLDHLHKRIDTSRLSLDVLEPSDVEEIQAGVGGDEMLTELAAACQRVSLSRRFHNDAVRACRELREQAVVRTFRLAGHTPWPLMVEMDDEAPDFQP